METDTTLETIVFNLIEVVEKMMLQIDNLNNAVRLLNDRQG